MKKIISLLLAASLVIGVASTLSGCKRKVDSGTEAAKLLLANERLDENLIAEKINVGLNNLTKTASTNRVASPLSYLSPTAKSTAAHTWSDFPAYNDTASQFASFLMNIEAEAKRVSEDIANMKNNVGVVDKWVRIGLEKQMLRVYDDADVLIVLGQDDDVHVYYRYTDESANNVYEMYSFMKYDDGTSGKIRTLYIPGARYEYQYLNSSGFEDCVTMENSRGYWVGNRYNYASDSIYERTTFTPIVIKDNFCYSASINMSKDGIMAENVSLVDLESGRELLSLALHDNSAHFILHASGIRSGLVSVGADDFVEESENVYTTAVLTELVTSTGVHSTDRPDYNDNGYFEGYFDGGNISYDYLYEIYRGYLNFNVSTPNGVIEEAFTELDKLLDKYGLTLYKTTDVIYEQLVHAVALGEDFADVFEWNGYKLDSLDNYKKARTELMAQYSGALREYEDVKNYETATYKQKLSTDAAFASLSITASGENSYSDGVITIPAIAAEIAESTLLESGKEYVLKLALSLTDSEGNPISVNTVALTSAASPKVKYTSGTLSLVTAGDFTVPKNLIAGDYALVVYVATADEEIRVSDMKKVGSFSTYNEKLESAAMDITVMNVDDTLHLQYAIKNSHIVTVASGGKTYTAKEIERLITVEILKKGAPFAGAVLEHQDGTAVDRTEDLGSGTYRMMCYLNTSDGLAQSYIYLVIA